jgi:acetylornithine deacetylase/succinyl-diaminopimelate desuccinylase-like protein
VFPAEAHAKISMRLVPDQSQGAIARLAERYLKSITPPSVKVRVRNLHAPNEKIDLDNFYRGNEAAVHLMQELGELQATPPRKSKARRAGAGVA